MKKWFVLVSLFALAACDAATVSEAQQQAMAKEQAERKDIERRIKIVEKADREVLALIRKGQQGCPGRVLKDEELKEAVVGKVKRGDMLFRSSLRYYPNGRLERRENFYVDPKKPTIGRYWINEDQQLCDDLTRMNMPYCERLILTKENKIMEEFGSSYGPDGLRLICLTTDLRVLGEKSK